MNTFVLLEGGERVLPAFPPALSIKAREQLERLGVEVEFLQSGVSSEERDRAEAVIARGERKIERNLTHSALAKSMSRDSIGPLVGERNV